jgi:probable F420-dependent oxidoreductase
MKLDLLLVGCPLARVPETARLAEAAGYDGIFVAEATNEPFLTCAVGLAATTRLEMGPAIALAFTRSPMITAMSSWELQGASGGRFLLGLGPQVKAHNERRFSVPFEKPAAKLAEQVRALRAIWAAFAGEAPLDFHGEFYRFDLLTEFFNPGPIDAPRPPVYLAAVNPFSFRMVGEVADGVHVHPLHSMHYLKHRLLPNMRAGAERAGRDPADIDLLIPVFIVPGDTPEERAFLVHRARTQIAFYGSTKNYAFQFDDLGFEGTSAKLNDRLKAGDIEGMAATITDEMLDVYAIVGRWDDVADRIVERYAGVAERITSYLTVEDVARNPDRLGAWGEIARAVRDATPA